jgi:DNA-binding CsgD family transcriptional regulator/PAS domain-containing protein
MAGAYGVTLEAIYAAAAAPARWPEALQRIADCFGDVGTAFVYARDDGGFGSVTSPSLISASEAYNRTWSRYDLGAERITAQGYLPTRSSFRDEDVFTAEEIETNPFYNQFLVPHGLGRFGAVAISPDPHVIGVLSVQRAKAKPPFSGDELALLEDIARHAEQALRLSIRLFDAELSSLGLADALSRVGIGIFVVDGNAKVVFSNPAGERLLGDGLNRVGERIVVRFDDGHPTFEQSLDSIVRGGPGDPRPILVRRQRSDRPLTLYSLPIAMREDEPLEPFLTRARAIVLVIDPQASDPADPAVVRDLLGLTLGQARVAALVGAGVPPRAAAQRLGISEATVRNVLKHVFVKVGVSRQSELSAMLTRLVLR